MASGQKFEGIDEKNEGADVEEPKGDKGKTESKTELEQGRPQEGGQAMPKVESVPFQGKRAGEEKETNHHGDKGGREVSTTSGQKEKEPVQPIRQGTLS